MNAPFQLSLILQQFIGLLPTLVVCIVGGGIALSRMPRRGSGIVLMSLLVILMGSIAGRVVFTLVPNMLQINDPDRMRAIFGMMSFVFASIDALGVAGLVYAGLSNASEETPPVRF